MVTQFNEKQYYTSTGSMLTDQLCRMEFYYWLFLNFHHRFFSFLQTVIFIWFNRMAPDKSVSIICLANADSWFITKYYFHPIIYTSCLLFLVFFCFVVDGGFCLAFLYIIYIVLVSIAFFNDILIWVFYPDTLTSFLGTINCRHIPHSDFHQVI